MDPDTTRKVSDLLSLMDDMDSEIDAQGETDRLAREVAELRQELEQLKNRFDRFEQAYMDKREAMEELKSELENIFAD